MSAGSPQSENAPAAGPDSPSPSPETRQGFATPRALAIGAILTLLVAAWTQQAELVALTSQISESTPPIASILALFLVTGVGGLLARAANRAKASGRSPRLVRALQRLRLSEGEMLVVFVIVAITAAMPGVGLFRQVMPDLMVTQYFGQPADHLSEMAGDIPTQWAPTDPEVARVFWEGEDVNPPTFGLEHTPIVGTALAGVARFLGGPTLVPWKHWTVPVLLWWGYLSAYFIAALCIVTLFRRAWEDDEHLNFPVSNLAVEMIKPEVSLFNQISLFRDPVVWVGLSLAFLYNGFNALHVFNPGVPALGISYPLGQLFTESPWNTMRGLSVFYKPELLGFGYLVPSDALFSIWFFTLAAWFIRPLAKSVGYYPARFPFITEQAMGAFVTLGIVFIYQARGRLAEIVRHALSTEPDDGDEPFGLRTALVGAVVGAAVVIGMPVMFGVDWWVSLMYFGIMFLVLIVYCRNRAEMGFPIVWGYPLYQERASMIDFLGSRPFVGAGRMKSFTLLTMFSWLQRSVNQAITATGQESSVAAHRLGGDRRTITKVVVGSLIFGVLVAFLVNLSAYYEYGGLVLSSRGGINGGQMTQEVLRQFTAVSEWADQPSAPNPQKIAYTIFGALMALGIVMGRRAWLRFPFHAGGYALAYCHRGSYMWFPALLLWIIKLITLHVGGAGLYRRLARGFMAFTLGHFFSVGIWSLAGLSAGEWVRRYIVWFL
jgi:hypothetical protein